MEILSLIVRNGQSNWCLFRYLNVIFLRVQFLLFIFEMVNKKRREVDSPGRPSKLDDIQNEVGQSQWIRAYQFRPALTQQNVKCILKLNKVLFDYYLYCLDGVGARLEWAHYRSRGRSTNIHFSIYKLPFAASQDRWRTCANDRGRSEMRRCLRTLFK